VDNDLRSLFLQEARHHFLKCKNATSEFVLVYDGSHDPYDSAYVVSGVTSVENARLLLKSAEWKNPSSCGAGFVGYGEDKYVYHTFGCSDGMEPLVLIWDYHELHPRSVELCEGFRRFHNLFARKQRDEMQLWRFDSRGREHLVARITAAQVCIGRRHLLQYLAARQLALVICTSCAYCSELPKEVVESLPERIIDSGDNCHYRLSWGRSGVDKRYCSRLLGKTVVFPPPV